MLFCAPAIKQDRQNHSIIGKDKTFFIWFKYPVRVIRPKITDYSYFGLIVIFPASRVLIRGSTFRMPDKKEFIEIIKANEGLIYKVTKVYKDQL
jgi:hypothetical protein